MLMTKCLRCNKEIEKRWNRKYCSSCRRIVDDEIAKEYIEKHYKWGKRRKYIESNASEKLD